MVKGGKQMLRPGFLATQRKIPPTQKKTDYERLRDRKIEENNNKLNALGVKVSASSLMDSVQYKHTYKRRKQTRVDGDDDDYIPSDDEDHSDDESYDSFEHEILHLPQMLPSTNVQSNSQPQRQANIIPERLSSLTIDPNMGQHSPRHEVQAQNEAAPSSNIAPTRNSRGPTRGIKVQELVDRKGKLVVPISSQFCAAVGENASKLASKTGVEVRTHLPDLSVPRWKAVDDNAKAVVLQRVMDQFDLEGDPTNIKKAMATSCGRKLSDFTYKLYKKFKELKEARGEEFARNHPPSNIPLEKWTSLIDKKWNTNEFQRQSEANKSNRSKAKAKHRCGSQSLPVRVHAQMVENHGVVPKLTKVYKETHFNEVTQKWISPQSQSNYDKMIEEEAKHCGQDGAIAITQEDLSIRVLKPKSGNVKGLGLRPSFSIRTTATANSSD